MRITICSSSKSPKTSPYRRAWAVEVAMRQPHYGLQISLLEAQPGIGIVLLDMMMPEMDGYESTQQIRKNIKYRNLPILAVTAKAIVGDREKCIEAGASDYITKPLKIDQLLSLMRLWFCK